MVLASAMASLHQRASEISDITVSGPTPMSNTTELARGLQGFVHIFNSTSPDAPTLPDAIEWVKGSISSVLAAAWVYFLSFLQSMADQAGVMIRQIISQMIGTSLIGVIVYRYRDNFKDFISAVVNAAGSAVPEDWIDEEALVDIIEDAAGIDTPSASDEEGEKTPLVKKTTAVKVVKTTQKSKKR